MHIVNTNFRARITCPYTLQQLYKLLPPNKLHAHRPFMICCKLQGVCILIFTSLYVRIIGAGDKHLHVFNKLISHIPDVQIIQQPRLMTYTLTHQLTHTNIVLRALDTNYFDVTFELFPAVKFRHDGKEHINIFASGKLVITGARDLDRISTLIDKIQSCLSLR